MNNYIKFQMQGFNRQCQECDGKWEVILTNNQKYLYQNHPFLHSVFIDDHLTSITFTVREGLRLSDYISEISLELEKITFNIISRVPNLPIDKPICKFEIAIDNDGKKITAAINDGVRIRDEIHMCKTRPAQSIYEAGLDNQVAVKKNNSEYQKVFCLLQTSEKIIQFLGLYDVMSNLISQRYDTSSKGVQEKVHNFFGENRKRYQFIQFYESNKPNKKKEDSFTRLRNKIAHSMQTGVTEFLDLSQNISFECIQKLLVVINDLLCGKSEP